MHHPSKDLAAFQRDAQLSRWRSADLRWFAGIVGGLCPEMEKRAAEFIGSAPFAAEFHNRDAPNGKGKFQACAGLSSSRRFFPNSHT